MGKQGIKAGQAFVELFVDNSKLVRGLKQASAKLKRFGSQVSGLGLKFAALGGAVLAPLLLSTKLFAKMGDSVSKMAARTGFSVEALSELGFAAQQSGTDLATLENGIRRMQRTIADAGNGLQGARDALESFGLTAEDLANLSPEEQFNLIADRMAGIEDPTLKAAAAMTLFGRSGALLIPLLDQGAAGMEELRKQARALGISISTEDAKAAADLTDVMNILTQVLKITVFQIGAALAPVVTKIAKLITGVTVATAKWIKNNRDVVVTVAAFAGGLLVAGAAAVTFGAAIAALGFVLGAAATIVGAIGAVMGALVSPVGLVAIAVVGLVAALLSFTGVGSKAIDILGSAFGSLKDTVLNSLKGIAAAISAGNLELALKIVTLNLQLAWAKMVKFLSDTWRDFKDFAVEVWDVIIDFFDEKLQWFKDVAGKAWTVIADTAEPIWRGMVEAHAEAIDWLSERLVGFEDFVIEVFETIADKVKSLWTKMTEVIAEKIFELAISLAPVVDKILPLLNDETLAAIGAPPRSGPSRSSTRTGESPSQEPSVTSAPELSSPSKDKNKNEVVDSPTLKPVSELDRRIAELTDQIANANQEVEFNEFVKKGGDLLSRIGKVFGDAFDKGQANSGKSKAQTELEKVTGGFGEDGLAGRIGGSGLGTAAQLGIFQGKVIGAGGGGGGSDLPAIKQSNERMAKDIGRMVRCVCMIERKVDKLKPGGVMA